MELVNDLLLCELAFYIYSSVTLEAHIGYTSYYMRAREGEFIGG